MNKVVFVTGKLVGVGPVFIDGHIWNAYSFAVNRHHTNCSKKGHWFINDKLFSKKDLEAAEKAAWEDYKKEKGILC